MFDIRRWKILSYIQRSKRRVRDFKEDEVTKDKQLMKLAISQNSKIFARNYFRVFLGKLQRVAAVIFQSYLKKHT